MGSSSTEKQKRKTKRKKEKKEKERKKDLFGLLPSFPFLLQVPVFAMASSALLAFQRRRMPFRHCKERPKLAAVQRALAIQRIYFISHVCM
jgi:hypothetical protein